MWQRILVWALNWIAQHGNIRIFASPVPIGNRLFGRDVPNVVDKYLVIQFLKDDKVIWSGYWQLS